MDVTAEPCCDEEGINGMPGWWDTSALNIPRFPPAQLEKLGKSPVLIPGSLWQQWRWGVGGCWRNWRKAEGRETHQRSGERGRIEKRGWKSSSHHLFFFFSCQSCRGVCWFQPFAERVLFSWKWGTGSSFVPCSALTEFTNTPPHIRHTVFGRRVKVGLFLAADSSHLWVANLFTCLFFSERIFFFLLFFSSPSNFKLGEYQRLKVLFF